MSFYCIYIKTCMKPVFPRIFLSAIGQAACHLCIASKQLQGSTRQRVVPAKLGERVDNGVCFLRRLNGHAPKSINAP